MQKGDRNIRLGLFVIIGTVMLISALYFIGDRQNLFGSNFRISAKFVNVNGLMPGNNVRFAGIDVGTVESVEIINDSSVHVVMVIEKKVRKFIKKNAVVSIGTDGLMGNKLVNINAAKEPSENVDDDDVLQTLNGIEMDEMVHTLNTTNENVKMISANLLTITDKFNSKNSLWSILMDTVVAENVKSALVNIKVMSNHTLSVTGDLRDITSGIKNGKGTLGALVTDTTLSARIGQVVVKLEKFSDTAAIISGDISQLLKKLKKGEGAIGVLLSDTAFVNDLNKSMKNIKNGSENFNENMEALKYSWPFKKYFKEEGKKNNKK